MYLKPIDTGLLQLSFEKYRTISILKEIYMR